MKKTVLIICLILSLVIIIALGAWWYQNKSTTEPKNFTSVKGRIVKIEGLKNNQKITSPFTFNGQVKGGWSFEASFPVVLLDEEGNILAQNPAILEGDWMTEDYVPFQALLVFEKPQVAKGKIILQKDNPSGNPEMDDSVEIPVRF